ncbi:MAG: patatin-like phospholipase family protein [Hyphomicrobiales bacterium]|nr:patatin-like phospholipase family protein [Hyphomicrobiales bacterium]
MKTARQSTIGLALGAGGARGFAHISVLEALDELGLRPARISGTSIGAIIGAGYASGLAGREIRAHVLEVLGDRGRVLAKLMQLRPRRFKEWFARGVLNAVQLDAERIIDLFVPDSLAQDFGDLSTPLSIIATDFYGWSECEMTEGPLRAAIAASIAFPPLFTPVIHKGRVMVDGGMVNPLPADKLAGSDIVIAVDVVSGPAQRDGREIPTPMNAIFGAAQILMQSIISEKLRSDRPDILLRPDVNEFRVLDFLKVRAILKAADPTKEELKRRLELILNTS